VQQQALREFALQQRVIRQQAGSRKRERTRRSMARIQAKVTDRRKDCLTVRAKRCSGA
jgi:hypothetical protein